MIAFTKPLGGLLLILFAAALSLAFAPQRPPRRTEAETRLGINLAGASDWSTELPFVDVFRLSREWISQKEGEGWGKGPKLHLDAHGWVRRLEPGCWAETLLCTIEGGHYPGGEYVVLYDGKGALAFANAATVASSRPGRVAIRVDPRKGAISLKLTATAPRDPVRNIRVLMPGHEKTYRSDPWNPAFLKLWRGMACLRFMDLMKTNDSPIASWSDRPTADDATFIPKGVPVELLVDLANRLKADAWFCMPHQADDEYVRNFAKIVREKLDPKLKAYVEYSNEIWNGTFGQHAYAGEQGKRLGFSEKPWEATWRYIGYRSAQIFKLWEEAFGGRERLVRVLASQASNSYVSEQIASFRDAYKNADALAIAPYLTMNLAPNGKPSASEVADWSVDQVLDVLEQKSLPQSVSWMRENKKVADQFGLKLVAYEGGQHMVGVQGGENNEPLTKLLHAANANPRIGAIYRTYFDAWREAGGDLFCYFSSVGAWSKWGSWGLLQYLDEDPAKSPKFEAATSWARSLSQPSTLSSPAKGGRRSAAATSTRRPKAPTKSGSSKSRSGPRRLPPRPRS